MRKVCGMRKVILTGDRPTGKLHLGHFVGSLQNRVQLQKTHTQYVMIADAQALTDHASDPQKVVSCVMELALDYLSVGISPQDTTIFVQSLVKELFELTSYFMNLVTWNRLKHNPTVKQEIVQKSMKENVPAGFMTYPVSQAADISAFKASIVPVGGDQLPMIEQTNELVRAFNRLYACDVLKTCEALLPKHPRLVGTNGQAKMSKTLGNCIYLSDSEEEITNKIRKMYTDPDHIDIAQPGKIEGNVVFTYLDIFDPDSQGVEELKAAYQKGGVADSAIKNRLNDVMQEFLRPIRNRREEFAKDKGQVMQYLKQGTEKARACAAATMEEVRSAMGLIY